MARYKCIMCDYIFNEVIENKTFNMLDDDWQCPSCKSSKEMFKLVKHETYPKRIKYYNAIDIADDNNAIAKDYEKCIDCGLCKQVCQNTELISDINEGKNCVGCGACIQVCPVTSLKPKNQVIYVKKNIRNKVGIAYLAPAVRVTMGEVYNLPKGTNVEGKIITSLRFLGFKYVFDVSYGADITVIEEATELAKRIKNNEKLPMFTSCCPAWKKYAMNFYPDVVENISTCKSPIGMQDSLIKTYFAEELNIDPDDIFTVAIVPCTAKKNETMLNGCGADAVLTVQELHNFLDVEQIDFVNLEDGKFDKLLSESSKSGIEFGVSGGVLRSTLITAYKIMTGNDYNKNIDVLNKDGITEFNINMNGFNLRTAVVNGIKYVKPIIDDIREGNCPYHFIEVMNCEGGCINGAGNPLIGASPLSIVKKERINALCNIGNNKEIIASYENEEAIKLYSDYLLHPDSMKAKSILHNNQESDDEVEP